MTPEEYADCNCLKDGRCMALTEKLCATKGKCPFYKSKKTSIFATRLRETRERKGMMQTALADRCEISVSTLCGYEQGTREPRVGTAKKIADILGVSLDSLCE